jgi:Undecaprenyl-phosphate glucose phosphotransferase
MFQKRLDLFRSILYVGDILLAAAMWLAAYYIRFYLPILPVTKGIPELDLYLVQMLLVVPTFAVTFQVTGLYRRPWAGPGQYFWQVLRATALGVLFSVTITYFARPYEFSRLVFLHLLVLQCAAMLIFRPLARCLWTSFRSESSYESVLVVGAEELGRMVAQTLERNEVLGLKVKGFLAQEPDKISGYVDGIPVLGGYDQVQEAISRHAINMVVIALPLTAHDRMLGVVNDIGDAVVDIKVVPDLLRHVSLGGSFEEFEGLPFIGLRGSPMVGWARVAKRGVDCCRGPVRPDPAGALMLGLAIAVKLGSKGPVLFRQERMGLDGKVFTMLKFRSMREDAEEECGPVWACKDDPRCTRLGAVMRRTSMDELPQLFNVLKGEMSLVGPRPERPELITDFRTKIPNYMLRHHAKAGMTGWAQIKGWRGNTSLEKRIECDLYYIENWSLWLDLKIMLLTPIKGFVNPNAY